VHRRIAALAASSGVRVIAANTAYIESGDTGVGSESVTSLTRPNIAVLVDGPISPSSFGWLWFLLERRVGYRFTALRADAIGGASLERYNVLIVPDGNANALARTIGESAIGKAQDWVGRGGTLGCAWDGAAEFPSSERRASPPRGRWDVLRRRRRTTRRGGTRRTRALCPTSVREPGAAARSTCRARFLGEALESRHCLCYASSGPRLPVLLAGRLFLKPSRDGANPLTFRAGAAECAGWRVARDRAQAPGHGVRRGRARPATAT
jgi:hypothetical protein